jgi:hypothetical protein
MLLGVGKSFLEEAAARFSGVVRIDSNHPVKVGRP